MKKTISGLLTAHPDQPAAFERKRLSVRRPFLERVTRSARSRKVLAAIRKILAPARRQRILDDVRRQVASIGYALDDLTDAQLETALTRGESGIEKLPPLTGQTLYWILRRISPDARQLQRRKFKRAI